MRLCEFCEKINKKRNVLYEDKDIYAMLGSRPSTKGHIIVIPKEHYTIFEHVPDDIVAKTFLIANSFMKLVLKKLGATGVNLLVRNGIAAGQSVPHFAVHVIPRYKDDQFNLKWNFKHFTEDKMIKYQSAIKYYLIPKKNIEKVRDDREVKANYLYSQLQRSP